MTLNIRLLGPLDIASANRPLAGFLSDKVRALLIFLACEPSLPHRREALAGLLWPNQPDRRARANLRRSLHNLHQILADDVGPYLNVSRQTLQFNGASNAWIDYLEFRQCLRAEENRPVALATAITLIRGDFLAGFSLKRCLAFEEWLRLKRQQLHRQQLQALNQLTDYYEQRCQFTLALPYAWQQVEIEPWFEPGQRQLLRLLAATGRQAQAIAHYQQFQAELAAEIGAQPAPETRHLAESLQQRPTTKPQPKPFRG